MGKKQDPVLVAKVMKHVRDPTGGIMFSADEWRSAKQISSFLVECLLSKGNEQQKLLRVQMMRRTLIFGVYKENAKSVTMKSSNSWTYYILSCTMNMV